VSGDFGLTRVNELDYSSTKTDQDKSGSGDRLHGRIAAREVSRPVAAPTTGSAIGPGNIVRRREKILTEPIFTRIVGKRTSSPRRGGYGQAALFAFSHF